MFLGLVGTPLTYPEFQALRNAATTGGRIANAAGAAAEGAILGNAAILLGGFLGGYAVGEAILKGLESPSNLPDLQPSIVGGRPDKQYVLTIEYSTTIFPDRTIEKTITGSFGAIFFKYSQPESGTYYILTSGGIVAILNTNTENVIDAPVVVSARRVDGSPENFKTEPVIPQKAPTRLPVPVPTTIPLPGLLPPYPLSPEVYPSPEIDEDQEPGKLFVPGVDVKIPETGDNFKFTPDGVVITRSTPTSPNPLTEAQKQPKDPGKKVAVAPCPCPEGDTPDLDEILCRLKRLEADLLDDGFNYPVTIGPSGSGGVIDINPAIIYAVQIQVTDVPPNQKTQKVPTGTPTVFYVGWMAWLFNGFPGERLPVNYLNTNWIAPEGATGYLFQLHDGVTANSSYVKKVKKDYQDNC